MTPNLAANLKKNIPHIERGTAKPGDQITTLPFPMSGTLVFHLESKMGVVWHFSPNAGRSLISCGASVNVVGESYRRSGRVVCACAAEVPSRAGDARGATP